jgi:hypothetical protein
MKLNKILTVALVAASFIPSVTIAQALKEGEVSVTLKAGVSPSIFTKKSSQSMRATFNGNTIGTLYAKTPSFSNLQSMPFIGGLDLEYAVAQEVGVFLEGNYNYSKGKRASLGTVTFNGNPAILSVKPKKHTDMGLYAGGRYYFDMGSGFMPFVGVKAGIVHQFANKARYTLAVNKVNVLSGNSHFYTKNTNFSGGGQVGAKLNIDTGLDLILTGEAVYKGKVAVDSSVRSIKLANTWAFPVTAGIRFSF